MKEERFTTRRLEKMSEFSLLVEMQRVVAGMEDKQVIAEKVFHVLAGEGGSTIGLFDGSGRLRGFSLQFPSYENGRTVARTFRLVIDPALHGKGLEELLHNAQKEAAEAMGLQECRFETPALP